MNMIRTIGLARRARRLPAAVALALVLVYAGAGAASAKIYTGQAGDPAGDGPDPARDLTRAGFRYDSASGVFRVSLRLRGAPAPTTRASYMGLIGRRAADGTCSHPFLTLATALPGSRSLWRFERSPGNETVGKARRSLKKNRITVHTPANTKLRGMAPGCAAAVVMDGDQFVDVIDIFTMKPQPKPKLRVKLAGAGAVRRGASARIRVRVTNTGDAPARAVRVRLKAGGPAGVSPGSRKIARLGPGKARTVTARLKAAGRARGTVKVTARARARNARPARAEKRIRVIVPRPAPRRGRGGGLAGRFFWGMEVLQSMRSSLPLGLYFANRRFAYLGMPERGMPRCGRTTAKVRKHGRSISAGCLRYSYDRGTGTVRIAGAKGHLRGETLKLRFRDGSWDTIGYRWNTAPLPRPRRRFNVSLVDIGYSGFCGMIGGCVTWTHWLRLDRRGRFGMANSMIGSVGGGIGGGAWGSLSKDRKGHYRVLSRGRIRLAYASGRREIRTIAIQRNRRGRPDPVRTGILFGDSAYNHQRD